MTVKDIIEKYGYKILSEGELDKEISGEYCCDLLSIVMSKAFSGCAWVTVMGNINSVAVAVLNDVSCIVLADGSAEDEIMISKAKAQGVTVLKSSKPVFETALEIHNT